MKQKTLKEQIVNNRKVRYQEFYFRDLFSEIVKASILASAVMLPSVGCGISHSTTPVADELTCIDGTWRPTQNITPAAPVDHISIVAGPSGRGEASVLDSNGTPCQSATDVPACETQLAELVSNRGTQIEFSDAAGAHVIVRGEGLSDFLGSIDTSDEAALLVQQAGFNLFCGSENSSVEQVDGGFLVRATRMTSDCQPVETTGFLFMVSADGTMTELDATVISSSNGCVGRRPEGLVDEKAVVGGNEVARFFSEVARLEESAITAFRVLAQELEFHGAPDALVESCFLAAQDETRHTEQMKTLAHHFGGVTKAPKIESREVRPLFEVALENAVEGCIRETFGAMVGIHQSMKAMNERVRVAMLDVAQDETRHASVSWQIAAWIEPRLSESERLHIEHKKGEAIAALRREMESEPCETLVEVVGLPPRDTALAMLDGLSSTVWA